MTPPELPTVDQAEDAAANALGRLMWDAMADRLPRLWLEESEWYPAPTVEDFIAVCRALLRGPLAEDGTRRLGGYCMKAPRDPRLAALLHTGAQIAELAYTVNDPHRAYARALDLLAAIDPKGDLP